LLVCAASACAADYAGADTCKACHPAEYEAQSKSAHAHALAPSPAGQPGDWAFGAGEQAITFLSRVDSEHYRELGETWYRSLNGYGITPGHRDRAGVTSRIFDPAARILRCFACHSTGPLALDADNRITPSELGVRCEVCHGPGAAHARDPAHNRVRNPAAMPAAQLNTFCGQCHRLLLEDEREATDLRDPRNSRNEPLWLSASACFRQSKTGVSCVRCHSPHEAIEKSAAAYDRVCAGCHAGTRHAQPVGEQACVECHMPAVRFENLAFRNHRIAVYAAGDPVRPVSERRR
jgi:hypothetical protein